MKILLSGAGRGDDAMPNPHATIQNAQNGLPLNWAMCQHGSTSHILVLESGQDQTIILICGVGRSGV